MSRALESTTIAAAERELAVHNGVVLAGITAGHAVSHFLHQSFLVMLPALRDALGIDAVQIGAIMTAREFASGLSSVPGGILCDRFSRQWGRVMALCMAAFALGWVAVALSANYYVLVLGMIIVSVSASIWHLPSMAALSYHFARRRGTALAIHGVGGNIGDVLGPVATGLTLTYLTWRGVLSIYAVVPLLLALGSLWAFRGIGPQENGLSRSPGLGMQLRQSVHLLRNPILWRVNLIFGLRGMCYQIYTTFLPLFLADEVGFGAKEIGFHLGLLFVIGIVASPLMGYASDRVGRKAVVVPTLLSSAVLSLALALFGQGPALTVIIALLGLVLRSDYSILSAAALDIVGHDVATTTLGVLSFSRFVMAASAPLIAGAMYERWGMDPPLYLVTVLFALAGVLLATTRLTHQPA
ncbi:MAG: MFS transporter [Chloroflexi bacterium]|nr:MFS transporter [Chloroflexota bacterium]